MIVELQAERQRLDEAIEALERLSTLNHPRRGRPPRWLKTAETLPENTANQDSAEPRR